MPGEKAKINEEQWKCLFTIMRVESGLSNPVYLQNYSGFTPKLIPVRPAVHTCGVPNSNGGYQSAETRVDQFTIHVL